MIMIRKINLLNYLRSFDFSNNSYYVLLQKGNYCNVHYLEEWAMVTKRAAQKVAELVEERIVVQNQVVQRNAVKDIFQVIKFVMLVAQWHLVYSMVMRQKQFDILHIFL